MRHILSRCHREVLRQFAWSKVLLAFDYDGTLAPIVSNPERAVMRKKTRHLLEKLTLYYPCIVISGRAQADARQRLQGVGLCEVVGNHGLEPWSSTDRFAEEVQRWLGILEAQLRPFSGVKIENKVFSLAIHYRQSREKKQARRAILDGAASLGNVRIVGGKQVVNLLPDGAPHKGLALERERARLECDTAIYIGDDETDEDVFTLDQPGLLTIRVGANLKSHASYFVRGQDEIDDVLRVLLDLRKNGEVQRRTGT